jgi:hypothetical protein
VAGRLLGFRCRVLLAASLNGWGAVTAGLGPAVRHLRIVVVAAGRPGEALLELGEQGLVLLVEQLGRLAQPLVLPHDVAVLQVQLRVQPLHLSSAAKLHSHRNVEVK